MNRLPKHPPTRKCVECGWRPTRKDSGLCKHCRDPESDTANDRHKPTVDELARYHEWQQSRAKNAGFDIDDGDDRDVMEAMGVLTPFAEWQQRWGLTGVGDAEPERSGHSQAAEGGGAVVPAVRPGVGGPARGGVPGVSGGAADVADVPVVRVAGGRPARGHLPGLLGEADGADRAGDPPAHPGGHGRAGGGAAPGEPPPATTGGRVAADGPADERRAAHAVVEGETAGAEHQPQDGGRADGQSAAGDGGPAEELPGGSVGGGRPPGGESRVRLRQFWRGLSGEVTVTRERECGGRTWLLVGSGTRHAWVPAEYTGAAR